MLKDNGATQTVAGDQTQNLTWKAGFLVLKVLSKTPEGKFLKKY